MVKRIKKNPVGQARPQYRRQPNKSQGRKIKDAMITEKKKKLHSPDAIGGVKKLLLTEPLIVEYDDNLREHGKDVAEMRLIKKFTHQEDPDLIEKIPGVEKPGKTKTGNKYYTWFNGSKLYYTNTNDLRFKLSLKVGQIKKSDNEEERERNMLTRFEVEEYKKSNGNFVVTERDGGASIINIKTDKLFGKEGLLAKKFDIRGVTKLSGLSKQKFVKGEPMAHKNGDTFTKRTNGAKIYEHIIAITLFIEFASDNNHSQTPRDFYVWKNKDKNNRFRGETDWITRIDLDKKYKSFDVQRSYYIENRVETLKGERADPRKMYIRDPYISPYKINDSDLWIRYTGSQFTSLDSAVPGIISAKVDDYMSKFGDNARLITYFFTQVSKKTTKTMDEKGVNFGDFNREFQMPEWANLAYQKNIERDNEDNSCIVKLVSKFFPDLYWKIHELQTKKGIPLNNFMSFCNKYNILYILYNANGELKFSNKKELENPIGTICAILFCAHILEIFGNKPKRTPKEKEMKTIFVENGNDSLKKFIEKKIKPNNLQISLVQPTTQKKQEKKQKKKQEKKQEKKKSNRLHISSFFIGNQKYVDNPEYVECKNFLEQCNMLEYLTDSTMLRDLIRLLVKRYDVAENTRSYIPRTEKYTTGPFLYKNEKVFKNFKKKFVGKDDTNVWKKFVSTLKTIDLNKAYPWSLHELPFLLSHDYRKHKITKNPTEIIEDRIYLAKPAEKTILLPETKFYSGHHLIYARKYVKFELLEELETESCPNNFKYIVTKSYECLDRDTFKRLWVEYIGKMERSTGINLELKYTDIMTREELKTVSTHKYRLVDDIFVTYESIQKVKNVSSQLPIAMQIKDMCRVIVFKKIIESNITNIYQVNTDSISFIGEYPKGLNPDILGSWKQSPFGEINVPDKIIDYEMHFHDLVSYPIEPSGALPNNSIESFSLPENKPRILFKNFAGSGKTHIIIHTIIPALVQRKLTYMVLTPTHITLSGFSQDNVLKMVKGSIQLTQFYKTHNVSSDIIQRYSLSNTVPDVDVIIIDEIGYIPADCHELLDKCNFLGKGYICFGDFYQLLPIKETREFNQPHYLKYMFNQIYDEFINFRNNFTEDYYLSLINGDKEYCIKEVNKYSVAKLNEVKKSVTGNKKFDDAIIILCYRNKSTKTKISTRDKYNTMILKKLGLNFDSIGARLICKNNKLFGEGIYNKKIFVVRKIKSEIHYLEDEYGKIFKIDSKKLKSHFNSAYAMNIHQVQGMTLKNGYYWANEDNIFINGRTAYTIISRIQQKINNLDERVEKSIACASKYDFFNEKRMCEIYDLTKITYNIFKKNGNTFSQSLSPLIDKLNRSVLIYNVAYIGNIYKNMQLNKYLEYVNSLVTYSKKKDLDNVLNDSIKYLQNIIPKSNKVDVFDDSDDESDNEVDMFDDDLELESQSENEESSSSSSSSSESEKITIKSSTKHKNRTVKLKSSKISIVEAVESDVELDFE